MHGVYRVEECLYYQLFKDLSYEKYGQSRDSRKHVSFPFSFLMPPLRLQVQGRLQPGRLRRKCIVVDAAAPTSQAGRVCAGHTLQEDRQGADARAERALLHLFVLLGPK